jgi:bis(5'-adenosyl)-triphosphatase
MSSNNYVTSAASGDGSNGRLRFGPFDVTTQVFLTTPHSFALVNLKPLLPGHVLVCTRAPHQRLTELSAAEVQDLFGAVQRVQRMLAQYYFAASPESEPESQSQSQSQSQGGDSSTTNSSSSSSSSRPETNSKTVTKATPEAGSFNIAIQDGAEAGQTMPHVHVHVIPRVRGSTAKDASTEGDAIYESMAAEAGNVGGALWDREQGRRRVLDERPRPGGGFPRIEDQARVGRSMEEMETEASIYRKILAQMTQEEQQQQQ